MVKYDNIVCSGEVWKQCRILELRFFNIRAKLNNEGLTVRDKLRVN